MNSPAEVAATAAGVAGTVLTIYMVVPQGIHVWRAASVQGLSALSWILFSLSFSLWIGYDTRVGDVVNLLCNLGALSGAVAIMSAFACLAVLARRRRAVLVISLFFGCIGVCALGRWGPLALVGVLLLSGIVWRVPQVIRSAQTYRLGGASEVSRYSWWLGLSSGVFWLIHGLLRPDYFIAVVGAGSVVAGSTVLALEYGARARRRRLHDVVVPAP